MIDGTYAATWKRIASRDALTKAHAEHTISGQPYEGVIIHGLVSETAASGDTETSDGVDGAAQSTFGAIADLHIPALDLGGYTDVTVVLRDSTDDTTYGDLITFTNIDAVGDAERKTVAGTVERYTAMSWLFNGAGSGQSITPFVAFYRNPA